MGCWAFYLTLWRNSCRADGPIDPCEATNLPAARAVDETLCRDANWRLPNVGAGEEDLLLLLLPPSAFSTDVACEWRDGETKQSVSRSAWRLIACATHPRHRGHGSRDHGVVETAAEDVLVVAGGESRRGRGRSGRCRH